MQTTAKRSNATMAKLPYLMAIAMLLLLFMTTINKSSSARTLGNLTPNHYHGHHRITFLMHHMLNGSTTKPSEKPATTKVTSQLPFPKPLGIFPPNGGIPIPATSSSSSTQTLNLSTIGFSFPTRAALQELEFGSVTSIDEELVEGDGDELKRLGKAQGVYVVNSEDRSSHMVAMTVSFVKGEYQDGLKLFGVHRTDVFESHVAVIGGTGKYYGANGYAVVKVVDRVGSSTVEGKVTSSKFLLFDVYFS